MPCKCGKEMEKQPPQGDGLHRWRCPTCRRTVTRATADNPQVRRHFGAGKKVLKWI